MRAAGVTVLTGAPFHHAHRLPSPSTTWQLQAGAHTLQCGHVVNAAGLHADRVAHAFGFARQYALLPFKGLYLYCRPELGLRTHIYPVPDLCTPFLGVHFTRGMDGVSKIGPTAIPALWRQQYSGLDHFDAAELADIVSMHAQLMAIGAWSHVRAYFESALSRSVAVDPRAAFSRQFPRLAWAEVQKYHRPHLIAAAAQLVPSLTARQAAHWGRAGIRAQLFHRTDRRLEMDFVVEGDAHSTHVVNVISPGWTCAMPFAAHVVDLMEQRWAPSLVHR